MVDMTQATRGTAPQGHDGAEEFAIITPSFWADFDLARQLSESIDRHARFSFRHYLIVSRRDFAMFSTLAGPHRVILCAEDILRRYRLWRLPLPRKITLPLIGERRYREQWMAPGRQRISGWTAQQIIKLSAADFSPARTFIFADSDIELIRDITAANFRRDGQVLLNKLDHHGNNPRNPGWRRFSLDVLGLPAEDDRDVSYVGNLIVWDRQTLIALQAHLSRRHGQWWTPLIRHKDISEYMLYGTFVRCVAQGSQHIADDHRLSFSIWSADQIDQPQTLRDENVAVHLQSTLSLDIVARRQMTDRIRLAAMQAATREPAV
jgi:hypothetical protein